MADSGPMFGHEIGESTAEELVRFVRALGKHRYVASRLHLAHAFLYEAAAESDPVLEEGAGWARRALGSGAIDMASKDERLYRKATDDEIVALLAGFWLPGDRRTRAHARLAERLSEIGAENDPAALPFDETREDDVFPRLLDAGWELLPIAALDAERHKGAIAAIDYEVARFEEENAEPPVVALNELPLVGATELLHAFGGDGRARAPFVLWAEGHADYVDYVLRGVLRAAKIAPRDADAAAG